MLGTTTISGVIIIFGVRIAPAGRIIPGKITMRCLKTFPSRNLPTFLLCSRLCAAHRSLVLGPAMQSVHPVSRIFCSRRRAHSLAHRINTLSLRIGITISGVWHPLVRNNIKHQLLCVVSKPFLLATCSHSSSVAGSLQHTPKLILAVGFNTGGRPIHFLVIVITIISGVPIASLCFGICRLFKCETGQFSGSSAFLFGVRGRNAVNALGDSNLEYVIWYIFIWCGIGPIRSLRIGNHHLRGTHSTRWSNNSRQSYYALSQNLFLLATCLHSSSVAGSLQHTRT